LKPGVKGLFDVKESGRKRGYARRGGWLASIHVYDVFYMGMGLPAFLIRSIGMKVILTENVESIGEIGDVVNVAPGYARNFLLPKGLAMEAIGKNVRELEHKKRLLAQRRETHRLEMLSIAEKLNAVTISLRRKVAEDDKLYGSVSVTDIAKGLEEQGFVIAKKDINLEQPIKQLGQFGVVVRVGSMVSANIRVVIEKEE
jgi:large subunit ribosomal protein L9